jgi:hypothetical protein
MRTVGDQYLEDPTSTNECSFYSLSTKMTTILLANPTQSRSFRYTMQLMPIYPRSFCHRIEIEFIGI